MKINRPMPTENTRPLLLSLIIMTALSLVPMLSHGAVFWDDEMEQGNTDFSAAYMLSTMIPQGNMAYDTSVKFSGSGSVRLNYTSNCQVAGTSNQCGGSITRQFPPSDEVYKRVYFRMSGASPIVTASGLFETSMTAFTKMLKGQAQPATNGFIARHWWVMGCCYSKNFMLSMERVPVQTSSTNVYSSITLQDNRWYCIETHEKMNTPGVANGIAEAWVDGVKVLTKTDALWRNSGMDATSQWLEFSIFRQNGIGNIWWDRFAAGDTRIGCLGATSASDTTRPAPPQGLVIR